MATLTRPQIKEETDKLTTTMNQTKRRCKMKNEIPNKRRCNGSTLKFSVYWFHSQKLNLPWIDLAALRCPYGGKIPFKFIKKAV
jgi:hypothetical protein